MWIELNGTPEKYFRNFSTVRVDANIIALISSKYRFFAN